MEYAKFGNSNPHNNPESLKWYASSKFQNIKWNVKRNNITVILAVGILPTLILHALLKNNNWRRSRKIVVMAKLSFTMLKEWRSLGKWVKVLTYLPLEAWTAILICLTLLLFVTALVKLSLLTFFKIIFWICFRNELFILGILLSVWCLHSADSHRMV